MQQSDPAWLPFRPLSGRHQCEVHALKQQNNSFAAFVGVFTVTNYSVFSESTDDRALLVALSQSFEFWRKQPAGWQRTATRKSKQ
jgi:hypothetical protein